MNILDAILEPAGVPVRASATPPATAWDFDRAAIAEAARELELTLPVRVYANANRRWRGLYSFEDGEHRVRVQRTLDPRTASRVLWHELTHAMQHERGDARERGHNRMQKRLRGTTAYDEQPHEREARANEPRGDTHPLVTRR